MRDIALPSATSLRRTARLKRTAGELLATPRLWDDAACDSPYLWAGQALIASCEALERTATALERRALLPIRSVTFRDATDDTATQPAWCINPGAPVTQPDLFLGTKGSLIYQSSEVEERYLELVLSRQAISTARHITGGVAHLQHIADRFTVACNAWVAA